MSRSSILVSSLAAAAPAAILAAAPGAAHAHQWRIDYRLEGASVVDGDAQGGATLDLLAAGADFDLEKAARWQGAVASLTVQRANGAGLAGRLGEVQPVSNLEAGDNAIRLFEAWVEAPLGPASLKAGLIDLNAEFDASGPRGLFLNSAFGIGPEFSGSGPAGPSIYPVSGLGARLTAPLGPLEVKLGAFDGRPGDPGDPEAFVDLALDGDDGALLTAEAAWSGAGARRAQLGAWAYTADQDTLPEDPAAEPLRERGAAGIYLGLESGLPAPRGELFAFARLGASAGRFNAVSDHLAAGLVWSGPLPGRSGDAAGFAVTSAGLGAGGRAAIGADPGQAARRETAFELTYNLALAPWFSLQPAVTHVIHPGGRRDAEAATIALLRARTTFGGGF